MSTELFEGCSGAKGTIFVLSLSLPFFFFFFADYKFLAITLVWHVSITLQCTHCQADTDEGLKILNILTSGIEQK